MKRGGFTLVETLASVVIFGVVMGGLFIAFIGMWSNQGNSVGMPASQQSAQQMAISLANAFRGATYCTSSDSGCTLNSGVDSATSTSCNIYSRNSSGTLVVTNYAMSGSNFNRTVGGVTSTLATNASLTLTYYSSTTYNATTLTSFTPTSSTVGDVIAVQIVATVAPSGGNSSTYTTMVRLRNGP